MQHVNRPVLVGNFSSGSVCVCCESPGRLLPALLPWYFPMEKGPVSQRPHGVSENKTSDEFWQRLWKCMITNVLMSVLSSEKMTISGDLIFTLYLFSIRHKNSQNVAHLKLPAVNQPGFI